MDKQAKLAYNLNSQVLLNKPLNEWRKQLISECNVYVFGENYIAKRFDQINYKFCEKNEAKEILVDNLYALLRYKYFKISSEEIDNRIDKIISSFTTNLKSTLRKVSFDYDTDCEKVSFLPNSCIAFRNGVFDFLSNDWLFKYDIEILENISNKIYSYDNKYIIMWYLNFNFDPLPVSITETPLKDFLNILKEMTKDKDNRNYCFELIYNMSHDISHIFSYDKFEHLCQIIGYTILQDFSQHFVIFVGSGQNGKNSLFDGCFTNRVIPSPAANDLDSIEQDRFITGSLENKSQNIFLESSAKSYADSKMIKAITGSMYQTIEQKGVNKYSGLINCKFIFAANDQDKIKFSDTTQGFKRRVNLIEIYYRWDSSKFFMKKGDYYDTTFSDSLSEIKNNITNIITFIYLGMYGIISATKDFTSNFKFTHNDWKLSYSDIDFNLKDKIEAVNPNYIINFIRKSKQNYEDGKTLLFDTHKNRLYNSDTLKNLGYKTYDDMLKLLDDEESYTAYFSDNDVYINLRILQKMCGDINPPLNFTQNFKKIYSLTDLKSLYNNQPYVKITFRNNRLKVLK